jgi:hypothetical protein
MKQIDLAARAAVSLTSLTGSSVSNLFSISSEVVICAEIYTYFVQPGGRKACQ